jgi:hypothetical protein
MPRVTPRAAGWRTPVVSRAGLVPIRVPTPSRTSETTVISPKVSRPRKSASVAVTTFFAWASGVSFTCSSATLVPAGGCESAPQTTTNAKAPATTETKVLRANLAEGSCAWRCRTR